MHNRIIGRVAVGVLIVVAPFCLVVCADQSEELIAAARKNHLEQVQDLLEKGIDVNAKNECGETALMWTSESGHLDAAKLLLKKGADVNAKTIDGATALMWACAEGHLDLAKLLLEKRADVNAQDENGETASMRAADSNNPKIVELLKAHGATIEVWKTLKGKVAAVSKEILSIRAIQSADNGVTELQDVKLGLRTRFIPFRRPAVGDEVEVDYQDKNGIKVGHLVRIISR